MMKKLSFFGIFVLGAAGTVLLGDAEKWQFGLMAFAAVVGLMAATFLGWLQLPIFEKYTTVPFVKVVRFFSHAPEHDQYLAEYYERVGGHHG